MTQDKNATDIPLSSENHLGKNELTTTHDTQSVSPKENPKSPVGFADTFIAISSPPEANQHSHPSKPLDLTSLPTTTYHEIARAGESNFRQGKGEGDSRTREKLLTYRSAYGGRKV